MGGNMQSKKESRHLNYSSDVEMKEEVKRVEEVKGRSQNYYDVDIYQF